MKTKIVHILLGLSTLLTGHAQHYQFSQFYSAPTTINPAFAGANVCSRFTLNYRNQWSGIPGTFTTYQASFDHTLKRINSGIGVQFFSDKAGVASLRTTQIAILYAYEARINKKLIGRGGISAGSVQRKADYSTFLFGDQIARNSASSVENLPTNGITYLDLGAGILLYTSKAWFGLAASHLNKPDQSLMNNTSPLPAEVKIHGGYKFVIEEHETSNKRIPYVNTVTLAYNVKHSEKFYQMDLGIYYTKNWFVIGGWYRGIPLYKPTADYANNDALVFLVGITSEKFRLGFSHDWTLSRLSNAQSNGSNEISVSYQLCKLKKGKQKKNVLIACPKF